MDSDTIKQAMKAIKNTKPQPFIILPASIKTNEIDKTKYRGKGRPRSEDYVRIKYPDYLE